MLTVDMQTYKQEVLKRLRRKDRFLNNMMEECSGTTWFHDIEKMLRMIVLERMTVDDGIDKQSVIESLHVFFL